MDGELVAAAQRGDQRAFEPLALTSHARLQAIAMGILRYPHLAEDAVQQALLDIWRDLPSLREPARFEGWSYRLLVRICYAEAKSKPRWTSQESVPEAQEPRAVDAYATVLHRDELERAFVRLPLDHRAVVVLHRLVGLPLEEVAVVLGVPLGTVKSRHSRAMDGLRAALEAESRTAVPERTPKQVAR